MANISQMGIPAAGAGILHPKTAQRWQVTFTNLAALVPSASSRDLTRQAIQLERPTLNFEELEVHRYNSVAYLAGKHSWNEIKLTIEDDITGLATAAIQGQMETQQRLIGLDLPSNWLNTAATGSDYKFGTILQMLDGNEGVVEQWNLMGCWFKTATWGELDFSNHEAVKIDLTMRFDLANQVISGAGYGTALGGNVGQ